MYENVPVCSESTLNTDLIFFYVHSVSAVLGGARGLRKVNPTAADGEKMCHLQGCCLLASQGALLPPQCELTDQFSAPSQSRLCGPFTEERT